jgi:hypothetical protein
MSMTGIKKHLTTAAAGALVACGVLAASATVANAYVVCNRFHECWRVTQRYEYPADVGIVFYDNDWRAPGVQYRWLHDRDDRGYWYHGHWRTW